MARLTRFWLATAAAVGLAYAVQFLDRTLRWWGAFGLDYSTHTAVVVAVGVSLVVRDRRWLWLLAPALAGYAWFMAERGYHTVADIATTILVVAPLAWGCHRVARDRFV